MYDMQTELHEFSTVIELHEIGNVVGGAATIFRIYSENQKMMVIF